MASIQIKLPGQPTPRIDTRVGESITHSIDCKEILDQHELISSAEIVDNDNTLIFSNIRTRKGTSIEVTIEAKDIGTAQYEDHIIQIACNTIFNNKKLAVFQLRVHK